MATCPPHPAVQQLRAVTSLQEGDAAAAAELAAASLLALQPDHAPTVRVAADAWFQRSLARHNSDAGWRSPGLARGPSAHPPGRAEAEVNLGIVLQEEGQFHEPMRACRAREDTLGRIAHAHAHALAEANVGRLWLSLDDPRAALRDAPAQVRRI